MSTESNILINGNFELGNFGFNNSFYNHDVYQTYVEEIIEPINSPVYSVNTNPSLVYSKWPSFSDHTSGSGKMFLAYPIGTNSIERVTLHYPSLTVTPNTYYYITFYLRWLGEYTGENIVVQCSFLEENSTFKKIDTNYNIWNFDNENWSFFENTLNTKDNSLVRLFIFPQTSIPWTIDDITVRPYSETIEESSSSSSTVEEDIIIPENKKITYFSYLNGTKDIFNPIINNNTGMSFSGYFTPTNNPSKYDFFGYGIDKKIKDKGTIYCNDASKLFSLNRGYVKMILNFEENIYGGHSNLKKVRDYNEYVLWAVNLGVKEIESPGIGAFLTGNSLTFKFKSSTGEFLLDYYGLNTQAKENITLEFVWEIGKLFNEDTVILAVNNSIVSSANYNFVNPFLNEDFKNLKFTCLNNSFGHSNLKCTLINLHIADSPPEYFIYRFESSSSSSSSLSSISEDSDEYIPGGPIIGVNQPIIIFSFIDESSPYINSLIKNTDINEFENYFASFPARTGSKFVCFQMTPCPGSTAECASIFPGPSNVIEDEMIKKTSTEWTKMKTYFDQAVSDMSLNEISKFYLFFSIDNSGSMKDEDVRDAINALTSYVNFLYPNCIIDDTFGSKQERWIKDMLFAYKTLGDASLI